jgi:hypothetical protein
MSTELGAGTRAGPGKSADESGGWHIWFIENDKRMKQRILFRCAGNSCRSHRGEGWLR